MTVEEMVLMPLNSVARIPHTSVSLMRVPGGWIYIFFDAMCLKIESTTFIAEND